MHQSVFNKYEMGSGCVNNEDSGGHGLALQPEEETLELLARRVQNFEVQENQ